MSESVLESLGECGRQLNLEGDGGSEMFVATLRSLAMTMADEEFVKQVLEINQHVNNIAEDN